MCGFFGWFGFPGEVHPDFVRQVQSLLAHRGPDDRGFQQGPDWGLGFCRLSIQDLTPAGHQPMSTPDGRFWIVFNGEIYNFVELRDSLEQSGVRFRGGSDSEVLLHLLAREGERGLERLNGMFALAFVDAEVRRFLLARDRLGVKPLYYEARSGALRFASELKALLAWPDAAPDVDPAAVVEFLALGYLPGEPSVFRGYRRVAPGHFLSGSLDDPANARSGRYWQLTIDGDAPSGALSEHDDSELEDLLGNAVRIRLRSDRPVGIFLSGGLDSGLVAAFAAGAAGKGGAPLALTVDFPDAELDETPLAKATAQRLGLEHRLVPQGLPGLESVDRLAWFYDEPFADPSALPSFSLCEAAARERTVLLSGDGGDEAFAGYRRYFEARRLLGAVRMLEPLSSTLRWLSRFLPDSSPLRYRLAKLSLEDRGYAAVFDTMPGDPVLPSLLDPELGRYVPAAGAELWRRWARTCGRDLTARQQQLDYDLYLPDDVLVKMDRASMAHSIEVRSPLLDYRVVEWAARRPRAALLDGRRGKLPLRRLARTRLPAEVAEGRKRGFGISPDVWFREKAGVSMLQERLLSEEQRKHRLWDRTGVERLIDLHRSGGGRGFGTLLWRLLILSAWAHQYLDGRRFLEGPPRGSSESQGEPRRIRSGAAS